MRGLTARQEQLRKNEQFVATLAAARSLLVQAVEYGHILARFLIKRHCTVQKRRAREATPETAVSVKI